MGRNARQPKRKPALTNRMGSWHKMVILCYKMHMRNTALVLLAYCLFASSAVAQKDAPSLPTVTAFDCPKYPSKAESMRLQGMVPMQVTTDGHQVTDVKLKPSHPVLAEEAVKNVRTWKFADHSPTTFDATFFYVNQGKFKRDKVTNCAAKMDLPTKVTVSTSF